MATCSSFVPFSVLFFLLAASGGPTLVSAHICSCDTPGAIGVNASQVVVLRQALSQVTTLINGLTANVLVGPLRGVVGNVTNVLEALAGNSSAAVTQSLNSLTCSLVGLIRAISAAPAAVVNSAGPVLAGVLAIVGRLGSLLASNGLSILTGFGASMIGAVGGSFGGALGSISGALGGLIGGLNGALGGLGIGGGGGIGINAVSIGGSLFGR